MRTAARVLPVVLATLLLAGLVLPPAQAVPSATPMAGTLQFYGGEVRAVAQIGNTIYVGGSFTGVGFGSPTIARANLVAVDATTGQLVPGSGPRASGDVNALLRSPDGGRSRPWTGGGGSGWSRSTPPPGPSAGWPCTPTGPSATWPSTRAGTTLFLAGLFTALGAATRYNFASIAPASRTVTAWNPNIHASGWGGGAVAGRRDRLPDHRRRQRDGLRGLRLPVQLRRHQRRGGDGQRRLHRRPPDQPVHGQEHQLHRALPPAP